LAIRKEEWDCLQNDRRRIRGGKEMDMYSVRVTRRIDEEEEAGKLDYQD